ncbi:MAG TPA: ABC transporter ATP-binding protein [Methanotrichaceae archaeon]|nr:ABC transporter ATP-binding protein [Methanotrichaceae archaeon]
MNDGENSAPDSFEDYSIVASGLKKSFGKLRVLNDLSVKIPGGTTYCLLGPNGSGKTTLIRAVAGLLRLDGGDLRVLGEPVSNVRRVYPRIGYMTQHKALYPDLTLRENMEFYAGLYGIEGVRMSERISELLDMVDLAEHSDRITGDLSGGMYQRLSLACTLIHEPDLLLLDEPTVGIDPILREAFWRFFDDLAEKGATILITTHLMDEAERCKIVGYMRAGKMLAEGSPEELKRLAGLRPVLKLWVNDPEASASILSSRGFDVRRVEDVLQVTIEDHQQLKEVLDQVVPLDLRLIEPSIGDAFLRLAEDESR